MRKTVQLLVVAAYEHLWSEDPAIFSPTGLRTGQVDLF
jgi:hypothetical protein